MKRKNSVFLLITFFSLSFSVISISFSFPLFEPVVIKFGDSEEVLATVKTFQNNYPEADIIDFNEKNNLFESNKLMRTHGPLVIIGHGSNNGILASKDNFISWNDIATWISSLPNPQVYFLACDSEQVEKLIDKQIFTVSGKIDGPLGALAIVSRLTSTRSNQDSLNSLLEKMTKRISNLMNGVEIPKFLSFTYLWDGKFFEAGYPTLYPHPYRDYYEIYPQIDWNREGTQLVHFQVGTQSLSGATGTGSIIGGAIGTYIGSLIGPEGSVAGSIVGGIIGGVIGLIVGTILPTVFADEAGALWFWVDKTLINGIVDLIVPILVLLYTVYFSSLVVAYVQANLHYLRIGSSTYENDYSISDPMTTPPPPPDDGGGSGGGGGGGGDDIML